MSDMSHLYKAYAAVHNTEAREGLTGVRDEISEMTLTQLMDADLQEVAEEIIERLLFEKDLEVGVAEGLVQSTLAEAYAEGDVSPTRTEKITRLEEAFVNAFGRVTEAAPTRAKEAFTEYRYRKNLGERREDLMSVERGQVKIHKSIVAEDRERVKSGLLKMVEATYGKSPGQELEKKEKKDDAFGAPKAKKFKVTDADKKYNTPAWQRYKSGNPAYSEDAKYGYDKDGNSLNPADIEKRKRKEDKLFGSPKSHNKSTSQGQRMGGKSTIYKEEEELQEKDTYDQVAAVIDKDRAKKGTDDATWDSLHGKKKQAKKERDYAAFEREKMKRDAQRSGHPWKHAKGSTTEKEGKPSEKTKHVRDPQYNSYEPDPSIERLIESGKFSQEEIERIIEVDSLGKSQVSESGWHRRNPEKVGTPEDPDYDVLRGRGKPVKASKPATTGKASKQPPGVYKPDKDGKMVRQEEVVLEKDLSAAERRALPDKDFALPGKGKGPQGKQAGSYPIPDATHARMALAMVAKHGTPEEKATVRAKVAKKFPDIKQEEVEVVDKLIESGKFSNEEILRIIQD